MMTDAGLMLPEPARTLWRTARDTVRQGLDAIGDRIEYRLGGGTILAARWGHRISFDVDIDLDEGVDLARLEHAEHGWFQQQVRKLGAIPEHSPRLNLYDIRFGERPHEQAVQLWSHQLAIARGHALETVEGREELVLSNAQILRVARDDVTVDERGMRPQSGVFSRGLHTAGAGAAINRKRRVSTSSTPGVSASTRYASW